MEEMMRKMNPIKKYITISVIFGLLVVLCGCATTTVGVGYNIPVSPHVGVGMGFGIGF
jgi:hypothetical protein